MAEAKKAGLQMQKVLTQEHQAIVTRKREGKDFATRITSPMTERLVRSHFKRVLF